MMLKKIISLGGHARNTFEAKIRPVQYARKLGVRVGAEVKIFSLHPGAFGSEPYLVSIGDGVVITAGVRFITHDGSTFLFRSRFHDLDVMGPISVGKNSFIGSGSVIMPGVQIGENCVIGAMSVVVKSIPDDTVAVGSPARAVGKTGALLEKLLTRSSRTGAMGENEKRLVLMEMSPTVDEDGRHWLVR